MLMKRLLVIVLMIFGAMKVSHAQQTVSDSARKLLGEWRVISVQAEIYTQKDNRLLEKKVLDQPGQMSQTRTELPFKVRFTVDSCFFQKRTVIPGVYDVLPDGLLRVFSKASKSFPLVVDTYSYSITANGLELTIPAVYYQDVRWSESVKITYRCLYKRS